MGLNRCSDGRWVSSNQTPGSRARERRPPGGRGWCLRGGGVGGWGKGITHVSNRQSYLPCKSAFVNATFVSKKIKKNGKKKRQSIAAVSKTPQCQRCRSPKRHEGGEDREANGNSKTCSARGYAWLRSVQCKRKKRTSFLLTGSEIAPALNTFKLPSGSFSSS